MNGTLVRDMPNYFIGATGAFYFPGIYSVILPVVPAIISLRVVWKFSVESRR